MRSPVFAPLTVLAAAVSVLFFAGPASAHTSLIDVQPTDGGTVSEGSTVTLTFSDDLLELGTEISITDASGASQSLDVTRPKPSSVQATLPAMAAGPVTVAWRVVAGDGHPIEGALSYTAEGPEVPPESATPSASPATTQSAEASVTRPTPPSATASPAPEQADENGGGNSGVNWGVWVAIGVAIFAGTGAGVATKKRR
jgi:copper resistance protein C